MTVECTDDDDYGDGDDLFHPHPHPHPRLHPHPHPHPHLYPRPLRLAVVVRLLGFGFSFLGRVTESFNLESDDMALEIVHCLSSRLLRLRPQGKSCSSKCKDRAKMIVPAMVE